jgi:hypothetical protein
MHFFTVVEGNEAFALKSVDHLRDRRCRKPEELGEARRDDVPVLVGERVNGLEILLDGRRGGNC